MATKSLICKETSRESRRRKYRQVPRRSSSREGRCPLKTTVLLCSTALVIAGLVVFWAGYLTAASSQGGASEAGVLVVPIVVTLIVAGLFVGAAIELRRD